MLPAFVDAELDPEESAELVSVTAAASNPSAFISTDPKLGVTRA
jgi:hypothetical protein